MFTLASQHDEAGLLQVDKYLTSNKYVREPAAALTDRDRLGSGEHGESFSKMMTVRAPRI